METIRTTIQRWLDRHDKSWRALPMERQHSYTLYLFLAYLLLTAVVILKAWYGRTRSDNGMSIEHIDNPVRKRGSPPSQQDTSSTIIKEKNYERK